MEVNSHPAAKPTEKGARPGPAQLAALYPLAVVAMVTWGIEQAAGASTSRVALEAVVGAIGPWVVAAGVAIWKRHVAAGALAGIAMAALAWAGTGH